MVAVGLTKRLRTSRSDRLVFLVLTLFVSGCGSGATQLKTYPASGTITDKAGKSLAGGSVQFAPVTDTTFSVTGAIQDDGTFILYTIKGKEKLSGAPAGEYKVTILPPIPSDHQAVRPIELPKSYRVEARDNQFAIEVSSSVKPAR